MDRMLFLAVIRPALDAPQQATTSNNLANVHTTGFKADMVAFRALPVIGQGAPTRTYVVDSTVGHNMTAGSMMQTGSDTDFAVGTSGFFAVQAPDGSEAYSRDGGFVIDDAGTMRTRSGLPILSDSGPITVPQGQKINVASDGTVSAFPINQGQSPIIPETVAQIKLVNPGDRAVYKGGDGLFHLQGGGVAQADANVSLVPGALENSNVNAVDSLVQMISHARQFDLNVKMMQTADEDEKSATQIMAING